MRKQRGITIIALTITIIVILILAGVTISTLTGDNGLLAKAGEAKQANEEATALEKIQVEVLGSYNKNGQIDIENQLNHNLQRISGLKYNGEALSDTNKISELPSEVELSGYLYVIKENGNVEKVVWVQDKTVITNTITGETYEVGDYIAYDHTKDKNGNTITGDSARYVSYASEGTNNNGRANGNSDQTFTLEDYSAGWRVLDVKNGELRLISANSIGDFTLKGKIGYTHGVEELDNIGKIYGQGKGAESAKSVKTEDINKMTGYNPDDKPYGKGGIAEYGKNVTFYWKGDNIPYYKSENGAEGNLRDSHNSFHYYDGNNWLISDKSQTAENTETGREKLTTLKGTYYAYIPYSFKTSSGNKGLNIDSKEYQLLFSEKYWLSNNWVGLFATVSSFGLCNVNYGGKHGYCVNNDANYYLVCSINRTKNITFGIRPVITLNNNITIEKNETNDGSSQDKACLIK